MKRDELLATLRNVTDGVRGEGYHNWNDLGDVIAWLERLPAGCELVAKCECQWEPGDSPCPVHGSDEDFPDAKPFLEQMKEVAVTVEGFPPYAKAGINLNPQNFVTYLGDDERKLPDDLTKAGK